MYVVSAVFVLIRTHGYAHTHTPNKLKLTVTRQRLGGKKLSYNSRRFLTLRCTGERLIKFSSFPGDVVGPVYIEERFTEGDMIGFGSIGAETSAYNFGANIWCMHYMRLTNQLTDEPKHTVRVD